MVQWSEFGEKERERKRERERSMRMQCLELKGRERIEIL